MAADQNQTSVMPAATSPAVAAGMNVALLASDGPAPPGGAANAVPDVIGQSQEDALTTLQGAGFQVEVLLNPNEFFHAGTVSHQLPDPGALMPAGSRVCVIASTGKLKQEPPPPMVALPDVTGKPADEAESVLTSAGLRPRTLRAFDPAVPPGVVFAQEPNAQSLSRKPAKRSKAWLWIVAAILILGLAALGIAYAVQQSRAPVRVPNVVGLTADKAEPLLVAQGLALGAQTEEETSAVQPGVIVSQDPTAGVSIPKGQRVDIVVAKALAGVAVPDVVGKTAADAEAALTGAGLTARTDSVNSDKPKDTVIEQSPQAGTRVQTGSEVALSISKGPAPAANVKVPNVAGMNQADAEAALKNAGLNPRALTTHNDTVASGKVIGQAPAAGASVAPGTQVAILVSSGPPPPAQDVTVAVPNVKGMPVSDAESKLKSAGFVVETVDQASDTVAKGSVIAQLPAGDSQALKGSTVLLAVSTGPPPAVPSSETTTPTP